MAEQVQEILDEMVAPLADLQKRGIFSEDEITSIVARRRESEYRLRRLNPRKSDYLEYLEIEEKLENLRRLRTKRLTAKDSNTTNVQHTNQKHSGDTHGIRFLHLLWIRTLRKYRTVEMYLQYAEFCNRMKSYQQLSKAYQQALSFFPDNVDVWIGAASNEYFGQNSIRAARILMQRALRIHSGKAEVWIQYFRLELHWRCKLMGRKLMLQTEGSDDKEQETKDDDPFAMAKLVYEEAINSKAASPELPWQFVTACEDFPVKILQEWIVRGLSHDNEYAWIVHAQYLASESDKDEAKEPPQKKQKTQDPVISILTKACASLPTNKMFVRAMEFLDEYAEQLEDDDILVREFQAKLFTEAKEKGLVNDELLKLRVDHLPPVDGISLLEQHVKTVGGNLWIKYAALLLEVNGEESAIQILEIALTKISMDQPVYIVLLVQLLGVRLGSQGCDEETLSKLVHKLVLLAPANAMASCDEPLCEHARHLPAMLAAYLGYKAESIEAMPPKVVEAILASSCMKEWVVHAPDSVEAIMNQVLRMEQNEKMQSVLYERAIQVFKDTPNETKFRMLRDNELRYR